MSYDLCSSLHCNVCLLLPEERLTSEDPKTSADECVSMSPSPPFEKLLICSGCQLVRYCSQEHQKKDWPLHRDFCRAAGRIMASHKVRHPFLLTGPAKSHDDMERITLQVKYLLRTTLQRPLQYHEEELTSFPAYCVVCFRFKGLRKTCSHCQAVTYCSEEHEREHTPEHRKICSLLLLYYSPYKVLQGSRNLKIELHTRVADIRNTDLSGAFERASGLQLPPIPTASLKDFQLFYEAADFSCIATICFVLDSVEMRSFESQRFVIFVVGATVESQLWFREIHTKFFFLQYPRITELELYFIGPKVSPLTQDELSYEFQSTIRSVKYFNFCGLFHQFTSKYNVQPSLVAAFNCGFSEYTELRNRAPSPQTADSNKLASPMPATSAEDTWPQSIMELLKFHHLPILFTSFTRLEAEFDLTVLLRVAHKNQKNRLKIHIERVLSVGENPFRDLRPLRNWYHSDNEAIFYRNGYVQAVSTRLKY